MKPETYTIGAYQLRGIADAVADAISLAFRAGRAHKEGPARVPMHSTFNELAVIIGVLPDSGPFGRYRSEAMKRTWPRAVERSDLMDKELASPPAAKVGAMLASREREREALAKIFRDFAANSARIESGTYAPTPEEA